MIPDIKDKHLFAFLFLLIFINVNGIAQPKPLLRISIENKKDHVQTKYVMKFVELLKERTGGAINIEFYHSGTMYRDQEVINALYSGKVEMAVPGTWHVSAFIPEISYFLLPEFFGEEKEYNYSYISSESGRELISKIEDDLNVIIPGAWMDLGHAIVFTTGGNRISDFSDFEGKTIRVAGGIMNKRRIELLGADGVIIAWSDVPLHLKKGTIDGLLTTFETVKSADLWTYGVKYAFVDNEYFPQYVPMISRRFWDKISDDVRETIISTWNEVAVEQRIEAEDAQIKARRTAEQNGVIIVYPQSADLSRAKEMLLSHQQELRNEINQ
ncbi:TRAP transporter substrate-binding protein DctP [Spirochaeta isovalerica]|uniref:C4-dicarboxylate-binding protein DctP n=1 Tax=Spirochaeta isovalerica TaxID=150 RepID=A0A841R7R8_9SPIO|nr:TRAP transporter substrate-binding protein DctP [Spirochaeta isovalerica]MBB6479421.1 C4-dicarboxylate-binding protein DctP [Spirochaeta isovalerica]